MPQLSYLQAIREAQLEEMRRDPRVFILGEDVQSNMFGTTSGFMEEFGEARVRDTPIAEAGFTGAAAGAAMVGMRPIVDITCSSFAYPAMDQIISIIAKSTYLYGGQARMPLVLRRGKYYTNSTAAQHSDRPYSMYMNQPGLKIVAPSTPYDAKGLLKTAIRDDDPVMVFEDTTLWSLRGEVPSEEYFIPFGKADVKKSGTDVTVVAIAGAVSHALAAAKELEAEGISVEVIDVRSLVPLDRETILESVRKTGRCVTVDIANQTCSAGSEIAAIVAEEGFWDLRTPIVRVNTPDTHIPFSPPLEKPLYPNKQRIVAAVRLTLA